jgi:hypothetical protein
MFNKILLYNLKYLNKYYTSFLGIGYLKLYEILSLDMGLSVIDRFGEKRYSFDKMNGPLSDLDF